MTHSRRSHAKVREVESAGSHVKEHGGSVIQTAHQQTFIHFLHPAAGSADRKKKPVVTTDLDLTD